MVWPTPEQARSTLWLTHSVLADIRLLGYRDYDAQVAGTCCRNMAEALRRVVQTGDHRAFEESIRSFARSRNMLLTPRDVSPDVGTAPLAGNDVRALAVAVAAVLDEMALRIDAGATAQEVAADADYLEYIPLEVARVGPAFLDDFRSATDPIGQSLWNHFSSGRSPGL